MNPEKSSITQPREAYKLNGKFEYPLFYEKFQKAIASVWRPEEVSLAQDVYDWQECSEEERDIIGGILRGFTQLELHVSCYWGDVVTGLFPKHEVHAMARAFSSSEAVHAAAYSYLSDELGLDEFEAFLGDPTARAKIDYFVNQTDPVVSLGVFSGAAEGVSLFSSFAALLSFNLDGRFKGVSQIISWSALDEQQHSDGGCALFRELDSEGKVTAEQKAQIVEGFKAVLSNEDAFLEKIFNGHTLRCISRVDLWHYLRYRANDRMKALGIDHSFEYDKAKADNIRRWFDPVLRGQVSNDFFALQKEGSMYVSKPSQSFDRVNWKTLDLSLA
jgi:ribonucleoside-diphosphate reductase beta chain